MKIKLNNLYHDNPKKFYSFLFGIFDNIARYFENRRMYHDVRHIQTEKDKKAFAEWFYNFKNNISEIKESDCVQSKRNKMTDNKREYLQDELFKKQFLKMYLNAFYGIGKNMKCGWDMFDDETKYAFWKFMYRDGKNDLTEYVEEK